MKVVIKRICAIQYFSLTDPIWCLQPENVESACATSYGYVGVGGGGVYFIS